MPQPQNAIPLAAAPLRKFLRVVMGSLPRSLVAFPRPEACCPGSFCGFGAYHIAKLDAGGQSSRPGSLSISAKRNCVQGDPDMRLFHLLLPALALLPGHAVAQSNYPDRPIKMIVPLAAASAVDVAARIVTQKMADNMGQQFVILNQPGASGLIGAEAVARAEPDGYTIGGFNDSIMTMVPNLQSKMRWDILKDFEPVSLVATVEWGLIANNQASFKTAADLIAAAKAAPGKIDYGSGGPGSPQHLAMAMFACGGGGAPTPWPLKGAGRGCPQRG